MLPSAVNHPHYVSECEYVVCYGGETCGASPYFVIVTQTDANHSNLLITVQVVGGCDCLLWPVVCLLTLFSMGRFGRVGLVWRMDFCR